MDDRHDWEPVVKVEIDDLVQKSAIEHIVKDIAGIVGKSRESIRPHESGDTGGLPAPRRLKIGHSRERYATFFGEEAFVLGDGAELIWKVALCIGGRRYLHGLQTLSDCLLR
jgi:hypothetical protein